jgi:WD40 repeat protein
MALAVLPDGRIASGSADSTLRVWNPARPGDVLVLEGHTRAVTALAVLPDGRIASGSVDNTLRVWNLARPGDVLVLEGHTRAVTALAVLPDGLIASGSEDNTVRVWSPAWRDAALVLHGSGSVRALTLLPDGRIAGAGDGTVHVWIPAHLGKRLSLSGEHMSFVAALAALPDGRIALGSNDDTVRVWNPAQRPRPRRAARWANCFRGWRQHRARVEPHKTGLGADTQKAYERPGEVLVLRGHTSGVQALAVLPDGRIASGSRDNTVRVWDSSTGQQLRLFVADGPVQCLAVRPDGLIVVGCGGGGVHFLREADKL